MNVSKRTLCQSPCTRDLRACGADPDPRSPGECVQLQLQVTICSKAQCWATKSNTTMFPRGSLCHTFFKWDAGAED